MNRWKSLYQYFGLLIEARARFQSDSRFEGPLAPFHRTLLTARYIARNRFQRKRNVRKLAEARALSTGRQNEEPLVSVIIPTRNRCGLLMERSIPSALNQTYRNIELIVVGDRCTDETERKVNGLRSNRVRFAGLPEMAGRPERGYDSWLTAGIDASNLGIRLSSGDWLVHLDDDDELAPEHVEVLLRHAMDAGLEMVYGKVLAVTGQDEQFELGSFPPEAGKMTHSGVLTSSKLNFFLYDRNAWKYVEPGDWNLWRRMKEAGVRIGFVDRVLGTIYPAGPGYYGG